MPQASPLDGNPARWPQGSPCDPIGTDLVGSGKRERLQEEGGAWPGPAGEGRGLAWSSGGGAGPGLAQRERGGAWAGPEGEGRGWALTGGFQVLAELRLGLAVGPEAAFLRELVGHGGGGDNGFETALALGHVLLRVEEDDVDLGHVEHPQGHRGAQTHRDRQRRRLDVQLGGGPGAASERALPRARGGPVRSPPLRQTSLGTPPCVLLVSGGREPWY